MRLSQPTTEVWEWQLCGSCRGLDSGVFFSSEGKGARPALGANALPRTCADIAE
jgi:hypothetical protein